jgi:glycogen(starch) synthase
MKIALLVSSFNKDAKEALNITTKNLALHFREKKNEVHIITKRRPDEFSEEEYKGIKIHRSYDNPIKPRFNIFALPWWVWKNISIYPKTLAQLKDQDIDILHGFSSAPILALRELKSKKLFPRAKTVHTIKGYSSYGYKFASVLNKVDAVIVQNNVIRNKLIEKGCKPEKITIIHSPVDLEQFKPMNKESLKSRYGLKNKKVALYYGHMTELKGISYLLDAAKLIQDKDVVILLVSSSGREFYAPYEQRIQEENITNVQLITKDVKIEDYVNLADAVVLPYPNLISTEANPSCLLESIACKTPVVTTDLPELRELVTPNEDALMAEPKNAQSLAENILRLLKDKRLQQKLSANAFRKISAFDGKKIAEQHLALYKKLLSE